MGCPLSWVTATQSSSLRLPCVCFVFVTLSVFKFKSNQAAGRWLWCPFSSLFMGEMPEISQPLNLPYFSYNLLKNDQIYKWLRLPLACKFSSVALKCQNQHISGCDRVLFTPNWCYIHSFAPQHFLRGCKKGSHTRWRSAAWITPIPHTYIRNIRWRVGKHQKYHQTNSKTHLAPRKTGRIGAEF